MLAKEETMNFHILLELLKSMFELKLIKHVLLQGLSKRKLGALSALLVSFPDIRILYNYNQNNSYLNFIIFLKISTRIRIIYKKATIQK